MLGIIIVENDADIGEVAQSIRAAREWRSRNGDCEIIVVGRMKSGASLDETYISMDGPRPSSALASAITASRADRIIIIDAKHGAESDNIGHILHALSGESEGLSYVGVESEREYVDLPQLDASSVIDALSGYELWPVSGISVDRHLAIELTPGENESTQCYCTRLMVKLICQNERVGHSGLTVRHSTIDTICMHSLSPEERAACLDTAMTVANIEELFPNHPWQSHGEESAAASYHTLAALFIRMGALDSAQSCLQISEALEASPRALALKGLLALKKGEILGAVANMVSSLQHYEARKRSDSSHYLHFIPQDLELINSQLNSGLAALNKRENSLALGHFAEAVFNFDPFYSQLGIDEVDIANTAH